jgi:hydrogenase-4 component B
VILRKLASRKNGKCLAHLVQVLSEQIGRIQHGRISIYLLYSFLTLIVLLALV